jgi:elongation of very long chain fatty acids protein 6
MPYTNTAGNMYMQLHERIPLGGLTAWTSTSFEKNFVSGSAVSWAKSHPYTPLAICALYLIFVFGGQRIMKERKGFGIINQLAVWNFALSLFSVIGAMKTVPHLMTNVMSRSFSDTICTPPSNDWGNGVTGFWVMLFVFSKIPELVDTAFIVARNKPLIFLHWYHHVTVLLYCFHAYATEAPQALYFVAMNYTVHAIMYGYFCLMALRMKPKWLPPIVITILQLSQMVVGVGVQVASMVKYMRGDVASGACPLDGGNVAAGALMYASYFALFFKFMIERFVLAPRKARQDKLAAKLA